MSTLDDTLPVPVNVCMVPTDRVAYSGFLIGEADGRNSGLTGYVNVPHDAPAAGTSYRIAFQSPGRRCWQVIYRTRQRRKPTDSQDAGWTEWSGWGSVKNHGSGSPDGWDDSTYWLCEPRSFASHGDKYVASGAVFPVSPTSDIYDAIEYQIRARVYREDVRVHGNYAQGSVTFYRDPVVKAKSIVLDGNFAKVRCELGNQAGCLRSLWAAHVQGEDFFYGSIWVNGPTMDTMYADDGTQASQGPVVTMPASFLSGAMGDRSDIDQKRWILRCNKVIDSYGMPCFNMEASEPLQMNVAAGALAAPTVTLEDGALRIEDDLYDDVDAYLTYEGRGGTVETDRIQAAKGDDGAWRAVVGLLPGGRDVTYRVIASRDLKWGSFTGTLHVPMPKCAVLCSPDGARHELRFSMRDGGVSVKESYTPELESAKVAGRSAPIHFNGIGGQRKWSVSGAAIESVVPGAFDIAAYRSLEAGGTWQLMDDHGDIWPVRIASMSLHDRELGGDVHTYDIELVEDATEGGA